MTLASTPDPRRWWALLLLCAAQFLVILDTSIVGIALPALQRELNFDAAGLAWVFNAYVVAFGGLLLLGGRLADIVGPRRLFVSGFAILTAASLGAGLATSPVTARIAGKLGPKPTLVVGLVLLGVALLLFARLPLGGSFAAHVLLPSLLAALGISLAYIPAMITATVGAARDQESLASGVVNTTYQVGSAIGLAVMVAPAGATTAAIAASGAPADAALNAGFTSAFVWSAVVAFAAAALAAWRIRLAPVAPSPASAQRLPAA